MRSRLGASNVVIGLMFSVSALSVVIAQLPIAHLTRHRQLVRVLSSTGIIWSLAFIILPIPSQHFVLGMSGKFSLFAILFAIGECTFSASLQPLISEIVPLGSLGTYSAISSICWGLSSFIGPMFGAALLSVRGNLLPVASCSVLLVASIALATSPSLKE